MGLDCFGGQRHSCIVGPGHQHARVGDLNIRPLLAAGGQTPFQGGDGDLPQVALGGEAVGQQAVGHLAGHLGHLLADGGQEDPGVAEGVRTRIEHRGHQGVPVEFAAEVKRLASAQLAQMARIASISSRSEVPGVTRASRTSSRCGA